MKSQLDIVGSERDEDSGEAWKFNGFDGVSHFGFDGLHGFQRFKKDLKGKDEVFVVTSLCEIVSLQLFRMSLRFIR